MLLNCADLTVFQAKCLRSILGIAHSFQSRVSNQEVLKRACHRTASQTLLQQQLCQLGRVLNSEDRSPLFSVSFVSDLSSLKPETSHYIRRQGRPRKEWVPSILSEVKKRIDSHDERLRTLAQIPKAWKVAVHARFQQF